MYIPAHFAMSEPAACHDLMRAHAFATLVTTDDTGLPFATHLPLLLDAGEGPQGTLYGHVARPNEQWRHLEAGRPALAIFNGPHAYVSPRWYAAQPNVPTWNYVAVHASGHARLITEPDAMTALMDRISRTYEGEQWTVAGLPPAYMAGMQRGIVGFAIAIERLEGKAKLSQNRNAADRAGAMAGLRAQGDAASQAIADLMAVSKHP